MRYHLRSDGSLNQTLRVVGAWMCPCGEPMAWDEEHHHQAGLTNIAALHTLARTDSARRCGCERQAWDGSGQTISLIRLPGGGVVATILRARRAIGRFMDHLIATSEESALRWDGETLPSGTDDYELARRAGRPMNVVAAWHDALMHVRVGAPHAAFPCGPGVVCVWARTGDDAVVAAAAIHPDASAMHRLTNPHMSAGAPEWLRGHRHDGFGMWVALDRDVLRHELRAEAKGCGLTWEDRGHGVVLIGPGSHARAFTPDELIVCSLASGCDPLLNAIRHYLTVRRTMRAHP